MTRITNSVSLFLRNSDTLVVRGRAKTERRIESGKWWLNRYTPIGEDADLMERMPHNGYRHIAWSDLLAVERP